MNITPEQFLELLKKPAIKKRNSSSSEAKAGGIPCAIVQERQDDVVYD